MESIRNIYKIGVGPSSSHTMGPRIAAETFLQKHGGASRFRVQLFGSLAATGRGHLTDKALQEAFAGRELELVWKPEEIIHQHPNGMIFEALDENGNVTESWTALSAGGGDVVTPGEHSERKSVYPLEKLTEILEWAEKNGKRLWEYISEHDDKEIWTHLELVWGVMTAAIHSGLESEGSLPGPLGLARKASGYFARSKNTTGFTSRMNKVFAYALAVAEENAAGKTIATAPTCGSCGVLPAVLFSIKEMNDISHQGIIRALATAALLGNIVKTNGSIAGAEVGCQGEIGTACAMASGAAAQLLGGSNYQIEYAAEMGLEHNLGLTCDPVAGLVQIPCIERNAIAAMKAISCAIYAVQSDGRHKVTFDEAVATMYQTGKDLLSLYKETSEGGLAKAVH
jgi:L-serine dehydratase